MLHVSKPVATPKYRNPFGIFAACLTAAQREGWSWQRIKSFREAALSAGGLEKMQAVCEQHFVIL